MPPLLSFDSSLSLLLFGLNSTFPFSSSTLAYPSYLYLLLRPPSLQLRSLPPPHLSLRPSTFFLFWLPPPILPPPHLLLRPRSHSFLFPFGFRLPSFPLATSSPSSHWALAFITFLLYSNGFLFDNRYILIRFQPTMILEFRCSIQNDNSTRVFLKKN